MTTVNYNRDIEIFPVLSAIFEGTYGENPYKSPTVMAVNRQETASLTTKPAARHPVRKSCAATIRH